MNIFPVTKAERWGLLLFPFKAYTLLAPIGLFLWHETTVGNHLRGASAEATGRVVLGYMVCVGIFLLAAAIRFMTGRRALVAESLLLAGVTFTIASFLALWFAA
jgi:hypothetical protein